MDIEQDIVIVGAGISGLTASLALHSYGLRSLVLESSECLRTTGYALTLWPNAWRALDAVGVGDHLRQHSVPFRGIQVGSVDTGFPTGELAFEQNKYGKHECRRVRRKGLLEALEKELPQGTIWYSSKVVSIEESGHSKLVQLADGCVIRTRVVIGCDGVNSVVAKWLGLPTPISAGRSSIRGFAEYPAGHFFKPNFYIYFGGGVRFGFVPCDDKSISWFCNFNLSNATWHQNMSEEPVKLKAFVLSKIVNIPREVSDIVQRTEVGSISCAELKMRLPWDILLRDIAKSSICVAGDALHPMTPDLGQGGCSALEDGVILARCIGESFLKIPRKDVGDGKEDVDPKVVAFKKGVENYAKERRWRSFSLIAAAYAIGFVQASENKFICFLREKFLSMLTVAAVLKMADFDCGNLDIYPQFS
ncbi:monooxygenase 2 [Coffea arabica]|uniref:Monooxygenase 2 n=1 Tax=Coffea arabica TaxID=13443 RepID=A0A6P6TLS0_COFAR|nr:monooxygenase 2-like [Coffea arabica]